MKSSEHSGAVDYLGLPAVGSLKPILTHDSSLSHPDFEVRIDGWVDAQGDGEFAVALRSALLVPGKAILYAGAGIMGDSNPHWEYTETALKLRPMQTALGVGA